MKNTFGMNGGKRQMVGRVIPTMEVVQVHGGAYGEEARKVGEVLPSSLWLLRDLGSGQSPRVVKERRLVARKRAGIGHDMGLVRTRAS